MAAERSDERLQRLFLSLVRFVHVRQGVSFVWIRRGAFLLRPLPSFFFSPAGTRPRRFSSSFALETVACGRIHASESAAGAPVRAAAHNAAMDVLDVDPLLPLPSYRSSPNSIDTFDEEISMNGETPLGRTAARVGRRTETYPRWFPAETFDRLAGRSRWIAPLHRNHGSKISMDARWGTRTWKVPFRIDTDISSPKFEIFRIWIEIFRSRVRARGHLAHHIVAKRDACTSMWCVSSRFDGPQGERCATFRRWEGNGRPLERR